MPNWMLDLFFYAFLAVGVAWPFIMWMGIVDFVDKVTAKPAPPPHVDTPEEIAARQARVNAMIRQVNAARAEAALNPKPENKSFFGDGSRPNPADWLPMGRKG